MDTIFSTEEISVLKELAKKEIEIKKNKKEFESLFDNVNIQIAIDENDSRYLCLYNKDNNEKVFRINRLTEQQYFWNKKEQSWILNDIQLKLN